MTDSEDLGVLRAAVRAYLTDHQLYRVPTFSPQLNKLIDLVPERPCRKCGEPFP